jgi:hypothetical protein
VTHWDAFAVPLRCFWGVLAPRNVLSKRSLGVDYPLVLPMEPVETVLSGSRAASGTDNASSLDVPNGRQGLNQAVLQSG